MISLNSFLSSIQSIVSERPTYRNGGSAKDGTCDCIGLIIGAIRRAGGEWKGIHGSNYAARNSMLTMLQNPKLERGTIVYKAFLPGEQGYNLPGTYAKHPDRLDYYHVGVVISVNPLRIAHCTGWGSGSGIKIDTTINRWRFGGRLKNISYITEVGGGIIVSAYAVVTVPNKGTVNMRSAPTTRGNNIIATPREGDRLFVLEQNGEWWKVNNGQKTGHVMSKFLRLESDPAAPAAETTEQLLLQAKALIEQAIAKERAG